MTSSPERPSGGRNTWRLIAILASTMPLKPELSRWLYHAAVALHESGESSVPLAGDLAAGRLTKLEGGAAIGTLAGPSFEARIETEARSGVVRFLVTREGLAVQAARQQAQAALLN